MTKQFSNYSDLITFTRASEGHALRPVSYGTELVTNGTFDTDLSNWNNGSSKWTVSGSRAYHAPNSVFAVMRQSVPLTVGKIYRITFDYEVLQGQLRCQARDSSNQPNSNTLEIQDLTGTGSASVIFVPDSDYDSIGFARDDPGVTGEMYVDNVSIKEVLFDQPDGTLTLFEHPNNVPRVEYDADGNRLGLLVEEARTNLLRYSEDFENSYWDNISSATADNNTVTSPTGETNGATITATGSSYHAKIGIITTQNTTVTFSAFLKAGTQSIVGLHFADNLGDGLNDNCDFDLSNGTVSSEGSSSTAKIQDMGNGWYRCSNTYTTNATGSTLAVRLATSSAGTYHVFGAQFEEGSFPTSYIKSNSGSTTTRSADVASIPVADFGYNTDVGSVVAEYTPTKVNGDVRGVFEIAASTSSNRAYHSASEGNHWLVRSEGATPAAIDIGTVSENTNKVAAVYKKDDFAVSVNGASVGTDTSGNVPISIIEINIGALQNGFHLNGHIKSIQYYPRRLSDAQLVELTS